MPKDFAGRGSKKPVKKRKPARRATPQQRVFFHGPSFTSGALVGAAIVILAAYGPELLESQAPESAPAESAIAETPTIEFEFPDLLKESEVQPDPEPYAVPEEMRSDAEGSFTIQAASFRELRDAENLRASLLLENLPAQTVRSDVNGARWYRVVVGPFERRVDADRAMTRLRQQGLTAIRKNNQN